MDSSPPLLCLVVDAIPHDLALELWSAGEAPGFCRPRPMVAPFPSLTHVSVPMLAHRRSPGYELRYYDPTSREVRGGLSDPVSEAGLEPYRTKPRGNLGHVAVYAVPSALAYGAVRWIGHRFRREAGPWLGYLAATDGIGHFQGRDALRAAFRDVLQQVRAACDACERASGVKPLVTLASDHGLWFGKLQNLPVKVVEARLEQAGLRLGSPDEGGVLLVPFGDVGAGAAWCPEHDAARVAEALVSLPQVELVAARDGEGCVLFADGGRTRARVGWEGGRPSYAGDGGDPLGYGPLCHMLGDEATSDEWLQATLDHRYPDALERLRSGFTDAVEHPAPVLFSMADGWTYGPPLVQAAASLMGGQVGTHGSLCRTQSLGFAMSTDEAWRQPGPLRPLDVFAPWAERLGLCAEVEPGIKAV